MEQGGEVKEMVSLLQGMRDDLKDFKRHSGVLNNTQTPNSSSNVSFNVQGGGIGFRIAVTLCVIMFVLLLCSIGFSIYTAGQQNARISEVRKDTRDGLNKIQDKTDRMQDYLNIILQWSPELRKRINDEEKKK